MYNHDIIRTVPVRAEMLIHNAGDGNSREGNIMTKGIAQQLRDGSERIDEMQRKIVATVRIIESQFEAMRMRGEHFTLRVNCNHKDGVFTSYVHQWNVSLNDYGQVVIGCCHIIDYFLADVGYRDVLMSVGKRLVKSPSSVDTQGIYESMDEFVDAVFAKFPEIKTDLQPLLDAGK